MCEKKLDPIFMRQEAILRAAEAAARVPCEDAPAAWLAVAESWKSFHEDHPSISRAARVVSVDEARRVGA